MKDKMVKCQYCCEREAVRQVKFDTSIKELAWMCEECAKGFDDMEDKDLHS